MSESGTMQTASQDTPTFVIIFEFDRAQQSHVSIVNAADKSHTKITLVSSEYFNTANTSALVRGLIATTPAGLCSGAAGEWYQLGMKMPEEFFYPYLHMITDHLVPEKRQIDAKTPEIPPSNQHPACAGKLSAPKLHIVFELNRAKQKQVNFVVLDDGSYVKISLISPVDFDAVIMSSLSMDLMTITPSGVCVGMIPSWTQSGMYIPDDVLKPYADAIINYFTDDDGDALEKIAKGRNLSPTIPAPVISPPTRGVPTVSPPTLEQVYQNVVKILRTRGGHPALSMASATAARKLYNHIDSITRRTLTFEENVEICKRLVAENVGRKF